MINWVRALLRRNIAPVSVSDERLCQPLHSVNVMALDFELNGLDPKTAHVMSLGWVKGTGVRVWPANSFYSTVKTSRSLQQSPVIHGLTAPDIKDGASIRHVIRHLYPQLRTHILICHHAGIEQGMLARLAQMFNLPACELVVIDTMQLARYLLQKQGAVLHHEALTLSACRKRYNLPQALQHNALADAQACYELWLAQLGELSGSFNRPFSQFLHTGAVGVKKIGKKQS